MENSKRDYVAAASVAAVVVAGGIILFVFAPGLLGGLFSTSNQTPNVQNNTTIASSKQPNMVLIVLMGNGDYGTATAQYNSDNSQPIQLVSNEHIRFDSPNYRTPESIYVVARDMNKGNIQLLRRSYDVNNEFFVNLGKGSYQIQVQATWFESGSHNYKFNVTVA